MTPKITYIKEPRWANLEYTAIDCIVKFEHFKIEVPYTSIKHGFGTEKFIFDECASGKYGYILPYQSSNQQQESINIETLPEPFQSKLKKFTVMLDEANKETASGSYRAVAAIFGTILEELLKNILEKYNYNTPSTFHDLIESCQKKAIFDNKMYKRLNEIRKIRNITIHNIEITLKSHFKEPNKNLEYHLKKLYQKDHSGLLHYRSDLAYLWPIVFNGSCGIAIGKIIEIYIK